MKNYPYHCSWAGTRRGTYLVYMCSAESTYAAAKKAADYWGHKNTEGIDVYLVPSSGEINPNLLPGS